MKESYPEYTFQLGTVKKYIYLQQVRLKNKFICNIDISADANDLKIHKLLLQPFIENSIIHGFEEGQDNCILSVKAKVDDNLIIEIADNGKGMPKDIINKCNSGDILNEDNKHHIGMGNAITRMQMYYGDFGSVIVDSSLNQGTIVKISIPVEKMI